MKHAKNQNCFNHIAHIMPLHYCTALLTRWPGEILGVPKKGPVKKSKKKLLHGDFILVSDFAVLFHFFGAGYLW